MTHTPAPWAIHCDPSHYDTASDVRSDCGSLFASVGGNAGWKEQEANARLISAAPDLLNMLKIAASYAGPSDDWVSDARRIIAKAEGWT